MKMGESPGSEPGTTSRSTCSTLTSRPLEESERSTSPVTALRQVGHWTRRHPRASKLRPARSKLPLALIAQWVTYVLPPARRVHPVPAPPSRPKPNPLLPLLGTHLARRASREVPRPDGARQRLRHCRRGVRGRGEGGEESAKNRNHRGPLRLPRRIRGPAARRPPGPPVPPAFHVVDLHAGAAHEVVTAVSVNQPLLASPAVLDHRYGNGSAVKAAVLRKGEQRRRERPPPTQGSPSRGEPPASSGCPAAEPGCRW